MRVQSRSDMIYVTVPAVLQVVKFTEASPVNSKQLVQGSGLVVYVQ